MESWSFLFCVMIYYNFGRSQQRFRFLRTITIHAYSLEVCLSPSDLYYRRWIRWVSWRPSRGVMTAPRCPWVLRSANASCNAMKRIVPCCVWKAIILCSPYSDCTRKQIRHRRGEQNEQRHYCGGALYEDIIKHELLEHPWFVARHL